ncbi:LAETG motif-containing sortase-dependent surface protein [Streptomyces sp. DSM 42041]|uniref:LAETG motif-containing sortase-dependent surface protein n=1 Tax=Streptomyces hazeniae TaxID=3075538 RepID=A0ABU2NKZ1_9ACTN|nr:LAETG motif-containing sortase-dependent surface protein [Streptomyces sp. DSM 42041]MDT0377654.1 LAETG motif-containing sortase-dependent surface protein [Streptomyces sp. DSM 42041]
MSTKQHRRRSGIALGAAGVALAGSVFLAAPASAHTPNWTVDCDSVSVDLKWYSTQAPNTVTITAGGEEILSEEFGKNFHKQDLALPQHSEPLDVRLVVVASDHAKYNVDETKTSPVCEGQESESPEPEPTPSETTPSEEPSESAEPTPSESTTTPPVEPADDESTAPTDLAETGSSDSTPLIAGIAAAVVAAGAGLLVVARKRRSVKA